MANLRALLLCCAALVSPACAFLLAQPRLAVQSLSYRCFQIGSSSGSVVSVQCSTAKPYVALTRELGKNGKFQKILATRGIEGRELPCIAFQDLGAALPAALREEWEYVVVTSPEAAAVFSAGWVSAGEPSVRVACVGAGTNQALVDLGVEPVFVPSKATGKVLAAELPGPAANGRVLYPASAKAATHVQDGLSARGFEVVRLNTYDTVSATWTEEQRQLGENAAVVALASPSASEIWAERMGTRHPTACIGETSADACKKLGFAQIFFPESPGLDGWADSVEKALACADSDAQFQALQQ